MVDEKFADKISDDLIAYETLEISSQVISHEYFFFLLVGIVECAMNQDEIICIHH